MTRIEWRHGPDFAEAAEALQITTGQIILASVSQERVIVLYTPDRDGQPPVWRAELQRDADSLYVVVGDPRPLRDDEAVAKDE